MQPNRVSPAARPSQAILRRVLWLQLFTIVWMTAEASVALVAAWAARSPALFGFGGDSAIELFSAVVVLWRFFSDSGQAEKIAARLAGALLLMLAVYIAVLSTLAFAGYREPQPSLVGIMLLIVAAAGMPWLARRKRRLAAQIESASLKADAAESAVCGYLSWIALAGLAINAIFHKSWADPLAALALLPLIVKEGLESLRAPGAEP
jgi:divalent metal cation (Fe/Co/Zn/Cd) transporter